MSESDEEEQNEEIGVSGANDADKTDDADASTDGARKKKNWKKTLEEKKA